MKNRERSTEQISRDVLAGTLRAVRHARGRRRARRAASVIAISAAGVATILFSPHGTVRNPVASTPVAELTGEDGGGLRIEQFRTTDVVASSLRFRTSDVVSAVVLLDDAGMAALVARKGGGFVTDAAGRKRIYLAGGTR